MEAVEFIRTIQKMCEGTDCDVCPLNEKNGCNVCYAEDPVGAVRIVEEWAKEHQEEAKKKRTNKDVLLAVLPNVDTSACPKMLDMNYKCDKRKLCAVCKHEFWNEEVDE